MSIFNRLYISALTKQWILILTLLTAYTKNVIAQEDPVISESENTFVNELRRLEPRPKFFEFSYAGVENFNVSTDSDLFQESQSTVDLNKRISAKLRLPLLLKSRFTLLAGFQYRTEFFDFINTQPPESPFFNDFSNRVLSTAGMSLIMKKELTEKKFYYAFWNGSLNADELRVNGFIDQLKSSLVFIFVKDVNLLTQIGYGGGFGYIFGGASVFPVFIYNRTFSEKWSIETMLPKSVTLRYNPMPETYGLFKIDVNGASYFIRDQPIEGYPKLTFQRSAVNVGLHLEREIYDFIWFGLSGGYNIPINIYLSEPGRPRREGLVILNADASPILSFSIFMVIPKKIYYKRGKQR